ncbi:MAG TPA: alpha/beta hydrolase [Pseudonocardiaceae bacterium]|jgi:pimeloyl-ACP methyl ester carboxylesterase
MRLTQAGRRLAGWRPVGLAALVTLVASLLVTTTGVGTGAVRPDGGSGGTTGLPAGFAEGKIDIDGGALHYVRGGSGPALVLLHGWPETWWQWRLVMPQLATDHTVIAFDLPGLGMSSIPTGGFDKASTARRIHQAVNRLGFQQIELVGHDVGTLVAYPYARDFPTEVTRLAVLETPLPGFGLANMYPMSWHFKFNMSAAPIPETIMDDADVPTYLDMMFSFSVNRAAIDSSTYYRAYSDPARRSAGYEYYRAFDADAADNQANAATRQLTIPVLAVGGQYSLGTMVADSFRNVAGDVRPVVVPNSGHFVPEENAQFFVDCARLFFGHNGQTPDPSRPDLAGCAA